MTQFSIIIPCYNKARYIAQTLQSVCAQTYSNWECIVVDDGSCDNSCEIIEHIAQNEPRIKPIFKMNSGVSDSRNIGLRAANGEYVIFLDGDDAFTPEKLALTISAFEANPDANIVYSGYNFLYENKTTSKGNFRLKLNTTNVYIDLLSHWDEDLIVPIHCCCYRRSFLLSHNIEFDLTLKNKEDWDFILQVARHTNSFTLIDNELVSYLVVKESRSSVHCNTMFEGTDQLFCKHYNEQDHDICRAIAYNLRYRIVRNKLIKLLGKHEPKLKLKFFKVVQLQGIKYLSRKLIPIVIFRCIYKLIKKT